jgi:hypothetical protein
VPENMPPPIPAAFFAVYNLIIQLFYYGLSEHELMAVSSN